MQTTAAVLAALVTTLLLAVGLALLTVGVRIGDGAAASELRALGASFDRVDARGSSDIDIEVRPGAEPSVTVHAGEESLDDVETRVDGGTLIVDERDDGSRPLIDINTRTPRIVVVAPELTAAELHGSGDLTVDGLDADAFAIAL
ncbi:MAG TPA: DUF2807 domain-containing protein, partial [Capillimicrobium sp.]